MTYTELENEVRTLPWQINQIRRLIINLTEYRHTSSRLGTNGAGQDVVGSFTSILKAEPLSTVHIALTMGGNFGEVYLTDNESLDAIVVLARTHMNALENKFLDCKAALEAVQTLLNPGPGAL